MHDYKELYYFCSKQSYPTKNKRERMSRQIQGRERILYYSANKVDWRQVPRDREHVERILESCHSSLEGTVTLVAL